MMVAELDWISAVTSMPTARKTIGGYAASRSGSNSAVALIAPVFMNSSPMSMRPSPATRWLNPARLVPARDQTTPRPPMATSGSASASMSSLKPIVATIQPVAVVPRFEPKTMPIALDSEMMPVPTKASTIRLTTELDCRAAVVAAPATTLLSGWAVCSRRNFLNGRPVRCLSACSSWCMPNRNRPSPAASRQMSIPVSKSGMIARSGIMVGPIKCHPTGRTR